MISCEKLFQRKKYTQLFFKKGEIVLYIVFINSVKWYSNSVKYRFSPCLNADRANVRVPMHGGAIALCPACGGAHVASRRLYVPFFCFNFQRKLTFLLQCKNSAK